VVVVTVLAAAPLLAPLVAPLPVAEAGCACAVCVWPLALSAAKARAGASENAKAATAAKAVSVVQAIPADAPKTRECAETIIEFPVFIVQSRAPMSREPRKFEPATPQSYECLPVNCGEV
jgi:hypothetical protein